MKYDRYSHIYSLLCIILSIQGYIRSRVFLPNGSVYPEALVAPQLNSPRQSAQILAFVFKICSISSTKLYLHLIVASQPYQLKK